MEYNYGYSIPQAQIPPDINPTKQEKRKIRKIYSNAGFALIVSEIVMFLAAFVLSKLLGEERLNEVYNDEGQKVLNVYYVFYSFLCPVLGELAAALLFSFACKIKLGDVLKPNGFSGGYLLTAVGVSMLFHSIVLVIQIFMLNGFDALGLYVNSVNYTMDNEISTTVINCVLSIIGAPIAEELLYRGVIMRLLSKVSARFGIIISALLFGLMHGNPYQLVLGFALGIVWGYIDFKAGSILPSIVCHAVLNALMCISDIAALGGEEYANAAYLIVIVAEFVIGLAFFAYLLMTSGIHFPNYTQYHKKRTLPVLICSVPMLIVFGYFIFECFSCIKPIEETADEVENIVENAVPAIRMWLGI